MQSIVRDRDNHIPSKGLLMKHQTFDHYQRVVPIFLTHPNDMCVHKKWVKMSTFSLIILIRMSECWEALFLSNMSMSFFMSSMLTSEKRNVSFSQLLCIASILEWSLHLKIALRVGSAMFSVTGSKCLYLETFRFFTIF